MYTVLKTLCNTVKSIFLYLVGSVTRWAETHVLNKIKDTALRELQIFYRIKNDCTVSMKVPTNTRNNPKHSHLRNCHFDHFCATLCAISDDITHFKCIGLIIVCHTVEPLYLGSLYLVLSILGALFWPIFCLPHFLSPTISPPILHIFPF